MLRTGERRTGEEIGRKDCGAKTQTAGKGLVVSWANVFEIRRGALWGWGPELSKGGSD